MFAVSIVGAESSARPEKTEAVNTLGVFHQCVDSSRFHVSPMPYHYSVPALTHFTFQLCQCGDQQEWLRLQKITFRQGDL